MASKENLFLLVNAVQDKRFDLRVVERNVVRGLVSPDEVEKQLKSLPDDSANAERVSFESISQQE